MTRINAPQPLAWMARSPAEWGGSHHRQAGDLLDQGGAYRAAQPSGVSGHYEAGTASRLNWLDPSSVTHSALVRPGRLTAGGGEVSRDLLRVMHGQGLAAFSCDAPPARGLVAQVGPGELALALRNGLSVGLAVEPLGLAKLPERLSHMLADFGHLPGSTPEWAVGLDVGQLSAEERDVLRRISAEFRLAVKDLPQGLWVIDRLGGLHDDWPAGTQFEPDAR